MCALPGARLHRINQCMFGSRHLKPTTLLAVHVNSMDETLAAKVGGGLCTHSRPNPGLTGVGEDGLWRTAHAKSYPSRLCEFLAACILQETRTRFPRLCRDLPPPRLSFHDLVRPRPHWSRSDEASLRSLLQLGPTYDGWELPRGLRTFAAPWDPYITHELAMDCMLHYHRGTAARV